MLGSSITGSNTGSIYVENSEITVTGGSYTLANSFKLPADYGFYTGEQFRIAPMDYVLDEETVGSVYKIELFKNGEKAENDAPVSLIVPTLLVNSRVVNYYIRSNSNGSTTYSVDMDAISSQNDTLTTFVTDDLDHTIVSFKEQPATMMPYM